MIQYKKFQEFSESLIEMIEDSNFRENINDLLKRAMVVIFDESSELLIYEEKGFKVTKKIHKKLFVKENSKDITIEQSDNLITYKIIENQYTVLGKYENKKKMKNVEIVFDKKVSDSESIRSSIKYNSVNNKHIDETVNYYLTSNGELFEISEEKYAYYIDEDLNKDKILKLTKRK